MLANETFAAPQAQLRRDQFRQQLKTLTASLSVESISEDPEAEAQAEEEEEEEEEKKGAAFRHGSTEDLHFHSQKVGCYGPLRVYSEGIVSAKGRL